MVVAVPLGTALHRGQSILPVIVATATVASITPGLTTNGTVANIAFPAWPPTASFPIVYASGVPVTTEAAWMPIHPRWS